MSETATLSTKEPTAEEIKTFVEHRDNIVINHPSVPHEPEEVESGSSLFDALAKAQGEFSSVKKDKTAKVEKDGRLLYTYQYADWADVLNMVRPVLCRYGLALTQPLKRKEDKKLYLVTQLRKGSEVHEDDGLVVPEGLEPQKLGAYLSYYKRICGCALLGVSAEEDKDAPPEETKKSDLPTGLGRKAKAETKPDTKSRSDEPNSHGVVITNEDVPLPGDVQKTDDPYSRTPEENKKLQGFIKKLGKDPIKGFILRTTKAANTDSLTKEQWGDVFKKLDSAVDDADLKKLVEGVNV